MSDSPGTCSMCGRGRDTRLSGRPVPAPYRICPHCDEPCVSRPCPPCTDRSYTGIGPATDRAA